MKSSIKLGAVEFSLFLLKWWPRQSLLTLFFVEWLQLKEVFPGFGVTLPPKRFLKDNYEKKFLDGRRLSLQTFLQNLTSHKDVASRCVLATITYSCPLRPFDLRRFLPSDAVKHFLCVVGRLSPFDSLEESRVSLHSHNDLQGLKSGGVRAVDDRQRVRLWRTIIIIFEWNCWRTRGKLIL